MLIVNYNRRKIEQIQEFLTSYNCQISIVGTVIVHSCQMLTKFNHDSRYKYNKEKKMAGHEHCNILKRQMKGITVSLESIGYVGMQN